MPILKPDEKVLMGENTKFYNTQGYLTLTSQRLIFDHKPRGLGKERYTSIDMQLDGIIDVFIEGAHKKRLIIITKPGSYGKDATGQLQFSVRDPYSWQKKLIEIRKSISDTQTTQQNTGWICPVCATLNASDMPKCSRCGELNPR